MGKVPNQVANDLKVSSLGVSFHGVGRWYAGFCRIKEIMSLTQLCTHWAKIITSLGRHAPWSNGCMDIMGITKHFLFWFKSHTPRWNLNLNSFWVQELVAEKVTDLRREPNFFSCYADIILNCLLMTHMHRLVHLSTFIVKIYIFTRRILTLGPTINQGVENKSFQKLQPLMKNLYCILFSQGLGMFVEKKVERL